MNHYCHSGGCPGADMTWETEGKPFGVKTYAYSFGNHVQEGENQIVLSLEELKEGTEAAKKADLTLKRNFDRIVYPYVKNLLSRNWFQVKNADTIFAISKKFVSYQRIVDGGTGWAVQMAIDNKKPVFVFDQKSKQWYSFNYEQGKFDPITYIPKLTKHFAGIGTREINEDGINAIKQIYKENFKENDGIKV
jgi:hypothetical protein